MKASLSEDKTYYLIGKDRFPRLSNVVTVEGPEFRTKKGQEEVLKETIEWGTKVHLITALDDQKKINEVINIDLCKSLEVWRDWVEKYVKSFKAIEKIVFSKRLWVAGTVDRVGKIKGDKGYSIIDLKTGSLYEGIGIRLAGYKIMWEESQKTKIDRLLAVRIPRNDPYNLQVKEYEANKYLKRFEECCELYRSIHT